MQVEQFKTIKKMKKYVLLLVAVLLIGFRAVFGQPVEQEVIFGSVRTDGYEHVTKGAFWEKRPESKLIYEGKTVAGFTAYKLNSDHFLRFVGGEHNQNDKNYIIIPKGELVYKNNQTGEIFSAKCGNRIEYLRPVDKVRIIEKQVVSVVEVEKEVPVEKIVEVEKEVLVPVEKIVVIQQQPQIQQMVPVSMPMMQSYGGSNFGMRIRIVAGSNRGYYPQQQCYPQQRTYQNNRYQQRTYRQPFNRGTMSGGRGGYTQNHGTMSGGRGVMSGGGSGGAGGGRGY
ncbi:TPA: hypothetical protein DIC38_00715 [Candidatus Nomurabacteria bacterium]|nr:MAG: hypothetical protein O210_OD1C00001G0585 [Parcubacteria bacterium RAAC4_OD1_1]HCY26193.1 hypothetical protein [Candidatus Nomurabacteria bacterium]